MVFDREAAEAEAKRLFAEAGYADGIKNVDFMQRDPNNPHFTAATQVAQCISSDRGETKGLPK